MSVFKRLFCLVISLIMLFSFCACSDEAEPKTETVKPKSETITVKNQEMEIEGVSLSEEATSTPLAKQDFSAKEITYYAPKEPSDVQKSKLAAFSKAHNCTVKVIIKTTSMKEEIAASIAAGTPYDIVENDITTFSKTLFYDIYEPLQGSVTPLDFYSAERPFDFGLSNAFTTRFTVKDNLLAVGSAESVDFYIFYYNRLLFDKSAFMGPQTLWETGRWSFEEIAKLGSVTSLLSGNTVLQLPSLNDWLNIKCIDVLKFENDTFVNAVTEENAISAATDYQDLIYGDIPLSIPKSGSDSFKNGKAYMVIDKASRFSYWKDIAKNSTAFKKNAENLGYVVLPTDISLSGAQPASSVRCYSALKGTKNPTAAPCFALFESRNFANTKPEDKLPENIITYLTTSFNSNGFLPSFDFTIESSGYSIYDMFDEYGMAIRDGSKGKASFLSAAPRINELVQTSSNVKLPTADSKNSKSKK